MHVLQKDIPYTAMKVPSETINFETGLENFLFELVKNLKTSPMEITKDPKQIDPTEVVIELISDLRASWGST